MPEIAPWLLKSVEAHPALMGKPPIPEQFSDAVVDVIPHKTLRECVLRYGKHFWEDASRGFAPLFLGAPGVYKSFAAAALSRVLHLRACVPVAWCDVPVGLNALERRRFDRATDEQIDRWKHAPWLVMDDFAMAKRDTWQHGVLTEVALARFDLGRPTCWTGNIEVEVPTPQAVEDALKASAGVQLARRILERSDGYRVYVR
jgi:DNA replication protein DnaC